jgi:hypothetical protein
MGAKSEAMMAAFEQACTKLKHENQEFHRQLRIDMQTFEMNMFPTVVTCQQNTINCVTANSPILDARDTAPSCLDIPSTSTAQSDDPNLTTNALHTAPSCLDTSPTSIAHSDNPNLTTNALDTAPSCLDTPPTSITHLDDPNLATKPYSTMSTRSISINTSPCGTWKKITLHLAFNVSLSNFSYVDPPIPQPHCLNLPPSRAKKKGVYSYYSI